MSTSTCYPGRRLRIIVACLYALLLTGIFACGSEETAQTGYPTDYSAEPLFTLLPPSWTGVDFENVIVEDSIVNYIECYNCFNGGGVGIGDFNSDGMPDVYLSGNVTPDKLYLNRGGMQFEDVTEAAGIVDPGGWRMGVTVVDINADGHDDIYVCRALRHRTKEERRNLLYINNGDATFTEQAAAYGLDDSGYSTHAAFFDYDRDGDLDMYLVNQPSGGRALELSRTQRKIWMDEDPDVRDKMYRNNSDGTFTDVSAEAGIWNYGHGLSGSVGDINDDGWFDIYVANDFYEQDYLYINNGDGTFTDRITDYTRHLSNFGMGSDVSDFNNDGLLDVVVVDMVAEDRYRNKVLMGAMSNEEFWTTIDSGFHYQYMFNTLQVNNGAGAFSEIGQMAGISKTDWSWAPFFADLDNDGFKDLYITNGIIRDIRHNDFSRKTTMAHTMSGRVDDHVMKLMEAMPSTKLPNYAYHNDGNWHFSDKAKEWGLGRPSFSNGGIYADLDADGDLDLVINNSNDTTFVYRNNSIERGADNGWVQFEFRGPAKNPRGIGARVTIEYEGGLQYQEISSARGFHCTPQPIAHFGLGTAVKQIERAIVVWPDGSVETIVNPALNQRHVIDVKNAGAADAARPSRAAIAGDPLMRGDNALFSPPAVHQETPYDDFLREVLLPNKMSQLGPGMAVGDVNGDGVEDMYIGGASGFAGKLYEYRNGNYVLSSASRVFAAHADSEDMGALLFDSDGDGDLDLYVVSGGNECEAKADRLQDRLYLNDGRGRFSHAKAALPQMVGSGSCVTAGDFDGDGDLDLFVGGRQVPGDYPLPGRSYLLENNGGTFADVTEERAPQLKRIGMVTSALWTDFDGNGRRDLIIVGEWMPITFMHNTGSGFEDVTSKRLAMKTNGWWNSVASGDFDNDGDLDYVVGNLGKNSKFKTSEEKPFQVYHNDFDDNGKADIVLAAYSGDVNYPVRGRECSSEQIPSIERKFPTYADFAKADLDDVYGREALRNSYSARVYTFESMVLRNENGEFVPQSLPVQAQVAPINGMLVMDVDTDGFLDIVAVGNNHQAEVETQRYDAGIGLVLHGNGDCGFTAVSVLNSGFLARGDARSLVRIHHPEKGPVLVAANNNDAFDVFSFNDIKAAMRPVVIQPDDDYAVVEFTDGRRQRREFHFGSAYLSASSRTFYMTSDMKSVRVFNREGLQRELASPDLASH